MRLYGQSAHTQSQRQKLLASYITITLAGMYLMASKESFQDIFTAHISQSNENRLVELGVWILILFLFHVL